MQLKVLGSSSHGNGYVLDNGNEALVIEAGVPFKQTIQAVNYDIKRIKACIVSHKHGDHALYINQYLDAFIPLYGTHQLNIADRRVQEHQLMCVRSLGGGFVYIPFAVKHDVECAGFYIYHPDMGYTLFVTDTPYMVNKFDRLNHIMIEANYSQHLIDKNLRFNIIDKGHRDRVIKNHMSIDGCVKTLLGLDLHNVKDIVLLHMSDNNSNEKEFILKVKGETGRPTYSASTGLVLDFSK